MILGAVGWPSGHRLTQLHAGVMRGHTQESLVILGHSTVRVRRRPASAVDRQPDQLVDNRAPMASLKIVGRSRGSWTV